MLKVLFLCLGNICRSPMAEAVFAQKVREAGLEHEIAVDSAGTGSWHIGEEAHVGTRRKLREMGVPYNGRARQLTPRDLHDFDYILAMDSENEADVKAFPAGTAKIFRYLDFAPETGLRDVPDPWYTKDFQQTYELVSIAADGFLTYLKKGAFSVSDTPAKADTTEKPASENPKSEIPMKEEIPVVTRHTLTTPKGELAYTVTTGRLPLKNAKGEIEAQVFFMAYTKDLPEGETSDNRPLMFSFNGGPGSSSVWLHLGAVGPKRVKLEDNGALPAPPYRLIDNPQTWLHDTDLVFLDPVGTGYSCALNDELSKKFWSVKGDIESVGDFIRLYLSRYKRWVSPLYLVGESYGTTRAAGLAGDLIEKGVAFNGIVLVSSVLNFQTLESAKGNDLPNTVYLPTYAATAHFHGKLNPPQSDDLVSTLKAAEDFALGAYTLALMKGDALTEPERTEIALQLSHYTGLTPDYIKKSDLRIDIMRFCKELLRDENRSVGRLDSRFKGIEGNNVGEHFEHDPSMSAIRPPYTACFNHYVRTQLGYETDDVYEIIGGVKTWNFNQQENGWVSYTDTSEALRSAFAKNPHLRVFIASGYYDLATPYFATEYTVNHLGLDVSLRSQIETKEYPAGHMMYIDVACLKSLADDVSHWIQATSGLHL